MPATKKAPTAQKEKSPTPKIPASKAKKQSGLAGSTTTFLVVLLVAICTAMMLPPDPICQLKVFFLQYGLTAINRPNYDYHTSEYNSTMLWGSYRPHLYHGMRTRTSKGVMTGLMWADKKGKYGVRHTAEDTDKVIFRWEAHDGQYFGHHTIADKEVGIGIETYMVKQPRGKQGGDWSVRFTGSIPSSGFKQVVFGYYMLVEGGGKHLSLVDANEDYAMLKGTTKALGDFSLLLYNANRFVNATWMVSGRKKKENSWDLGAGPSFKAEKVTDVNTIRFDTLLVGDFTVDVHFISHEDLDSPPTSLDTALSYLDRQGQLGCDFNLKIKQYMKSFDTQFEETFHLAAKGTSSGQINMAKSALSNYLGGIGYWHGSSLQYAAAPPPDRPRWPPSVEILTTEAAPLFSGVPSRAKFPRGFLWDEGFHQLLAARWNSEISKDIILHWLKLGDENGYIGREQIRGAEPRTRVPEEFVPQNPAAANPPTMTLQIQNFARNNQDGKHTAFLKEVWPYLEKWYNWFQKTQAANSEGEYRWKGREGFHCLPSGLDDHPRTRCLTEKERNVDLYSWVGLMSNTMVAISKAVGEDPTAYLEQYKTVTEKLEQVHWDQELQQFSDRSGCEQTPPQKKKKKNQPLVPTEPLHLPWFGYNNLFPFLTGIIEKPEQAAAVIRRASELMSGFGLRSLRREDLGIIPQHENYWTGPVWININFMFLRALRAQYAEIEGAQKLYRDLRADLIANIYDNFERTGKLWENYNPDAGNQDTRRGPKEPAGRGQGTAPFTGWTTLVLLMMSEQYE
eukprot:TRINITY_DN66407_c2_g1_i1.p1 TRINITY_DN66407_c2_g1~~TRINITY_DN66407_c2_g1_i1.p1  ORF type:complete len:792 (+),score=84.17 TRINITY_DN66407_c2_g1_i1:29-2404(+)